MLNLIGRSPINPLLFYTGKFAGYAIWGVWITCALGTERFVVDPVPSLQALSFVTFGAGLVLALVSALNLGDATRLGLPDEQTELKTGGLYRFSRHPMYVGFHLFTLSALFYTLNPVLVLLGLYSIYVYHQIITAEEAFLEQRFGDDYAEYKTRVRRYL
jgi:protein-S-isoprenylcysteine O-methyltransferase Ste14